MIDYNIEQFFFLYDIYPYLYDWLATRSVLEPARKSTFRVYNKILWRPIKAKMDELQKKDILNPVEQDFLNCKYRGKAYRLINYYKKRKGHVHPMKYYQSCSKTLKGISKVRKYGTEILIELNSQNEAIDIYKLLIFMRLNGLINDGNEGEYRSFENLERYLSEEEIAMPMLKENILNISIFDVAENKKIVNINRENWFRNDM